MDTLLPTIKISSTLVTTYYLYCLFHRSWQITCYCFLWTEMWKGVKLINNQEGKILAAFCVDCLLKISIRGVHISRCSINNLYLEIDSNYYYTLFNNFSKFLYNRVVTPADRIFFVHETIVPFIILLWQGVGFDCDSEFARC